MLKQLGIFLLVGVFVVSTSLPLSAQATDMSATLKRMDDIISQMQALRAEFQIIAQQMGAMPAVLGAQTSPGPVLTLPLVFGETNNDIALIQKLLATDSEIYPYGVSSGFFGPKTQEAIRKFQTHFNLEPVGVIGPATRALLEIFMTKYPDGNFPDGVLAAIPKVAGVSTSNSSVTLGPTAVSSGGAASFIDVTVDRGEGEVDIRYRNGNKKTFIVTGDSEDEMIDAIVARTDLSEADVRAVITFEGDDDDDSKDYNDDDAEDAIDDADEAIDYADDEIKEADDDGDDVDWAEDTLKDAEDLLEEAEEAYDDEDWNGAVEKAEEAEELAEKAEDRIDEEEGDTKGDSDEIKKIKVDVDEDESEVTVKYEDDDDYEFTVEEDKADEIIEEIADELDMNEDDVEDLVEFDYGDVDRIDVRVDEDEGEASVTVTYETGVKVRFTINDTDENEIIEEIADEIDEDEDDIEDWTDFD